MDRPTQLGKYRLQNLLATGGMGEVFLARQEGPAGFAKTVVIKRILRHLADDQGFVDMFLMEARLAALISHPNVVQIFELGKQDETYFIAMEYVHGRSLRAIKQRLLERKEVLSPILAARLCAQALQGLHYAHTLTDEQGAPLNIVHRDVSPDNVLVSFGGGVKLVDFGIAKAQVGASITRVGTLKGKYAYMAPEQIDGSHQIDRRADLYSCGVLLYELLTGARPYSAASEPALINAILSTRPEDARARNPDLPEELNEIIMRSLERDPAARFSSADEMSIALEGFIHSSGETLSNATIGAFLKDLYGDEAVGTNPAAQIAIPRTAVGTQVNGHGGVEAKLATVTVPAGEEFRRTGGSHLSGEGSTVKLATSVSVVSSVSDSGYAARRARSRLHAWIAAGVVATAFLVAAAVLGSRKSDQQLPVPLTVVPPAATRKAVSDKAPPVAPVRKADVPPASAQPSNPVTASTVQEAGPQQVASVTPAVVPQKVAAAEPRQEVKRQVRRGSRTPKKVLPLKPGKVALRVNPWAEVFYENRSMGITPIAPLELPAGKQRLVLKNSDLKKSKRVTVMVPAGGEVPLKVDMFE